MYQNMNTQVGKKSRKNKINMHANLFGNFMKKAVQLKKKIETKKVQNCIP